jgi:carbonic anhydrase
MKIAMQAVALAALIAVPAARAEEHHWSYEGNEGPANWGEFAEACKAGKQQSPINIRTKGAHKAAAKGLPRIGFSWSKSKGTLVNNGHTIQVDLQPGNSIEVGGARYELAQFHFHTPSEHLIDGHHSALEVHFVHKTADGKLGVVGILIDEKGAASHALEPVLKAIAKPGELEVDLPAILPKKHLYFTYPGSLTTPPCSEGVRWMVLKERLHTSAAHVKEFQKLFPHNARPAQALHDRTVEVDDKE